MSLKICFYIAKASAYQHRWHLWGKEVK